MSKAEDYITQNTKTLEEYGKEYFKWLTPDQARKAIKIAQEEIYEWLRNHIRNYAFMVTDEFEGDIDVDTAINDLKQAIK